MEAANSGYLKYDEGRMDGASVRVSMLPHGRGGGRAAEDLSHSLFWGFDAVLNAPERKIDPAAIPPEPEAPGPLDAADASDSMFWTANPNHSLLLINDLKHKGQVYVDDFATRNIAWTKLLRRFAVASLLLPVYILSSFRGPQELNSEHKVVVPRPSRSYQALVFMTGTLYWAVLMTSTLLYFIARPADISTMEVLLPVALHFFCFFVEALLRSVELVTVENFEDAANRIMCRMHVTGTSYAWNRLDTQPSKFVPTDMLRGGSREGIQPDDDDEDDEDEPMVGVPGPASRGGPQAVPEKENLVSPAAPIKTGTASLKDLVNLILHRQDPASDESGGRLLLVTTIICAAIYAAIPEVMRLMTKVYSREHSAAFYIVTCSGILTNFIICLVALDALAKSVAQLKLRVAIAKTFTQLNSKTAASSLGLFHFELQTIENLWGWLTLRSYLLRRGKTPQARVEIILSASFAFLVPLALMLAIDFFFSKSPVSIFIVSTFFFCFAVASYLLLCVWNGVKIQAIYRDQDVLLAEQLAIHYRICTTRDTELHHRLSNLHAAIGKIMEILKNSAGDGVVLSVLGFSINENFSRVLIGGLLSLVSAGGSSLLRQSVGVLN